MQNNLIGLQQYGPKLKLIIKSMLPILFVLWKSEHQS